MDTCPGIVFRDGPVGRRPAVHGGPDVWEVIQVFLAEDRDAAAVAESLCLRRDQVDAAVAYYDEHREEIDDWIEANRTLMEEAAKAVGRRP